MTEEGSALRVLDAVSLACIFIVTAQLLKFIAKLVYRFFSAVLGLGAVNLQETGTWAVVTGASDGIGKAFAEYLAKNKKNVVLISRNQAKLEQVAGELEREHNIETRVIAANFSTTEHIYHEIDKQLRDLDIGVLVNNVGMSYSYPEYFLEVKNKDELFTNIINCNIFSTTNMCKIVMPHMLGKRRGLVINIASASARIPSPLLTVYSASKSYVVKFSEDLAAEYSDRGITVQCLLPGYVATNMSKIRSSTWMAPSPRRYVQEAMQTVGIKEKTTGYLPHALLVYVVNGLSPRISRWLITRTMCNIRARAIRREIH